MKRGLAYICAGILFMLPAIIFAQGLVPCDGPTCGTCDLITLGDRILKFFIAVSVVLAAVMFAIGGLTMVTSAGDTGKVSKGKTMMTNAIVGFVIVLASWLIIDTALKMVLGGGFGPWNTVQCTGQNVATAVPKLVGGVTTPPGAPVGGTPQIPSAGQMTHAQAISALQAAGIPVVASGGNIQADCSSTSGCTSLQGINAATIKDAVDLKAACNCNVTITGGTEGGHSSGAMSHGSGFKYDVGLNPTLDGYIESTYAKDGTRSDGAALYKAPDGTVYAKESNHWDVLVPSS